MKKYRWASFLRKLGLELLAAVLVHIIVTIYSYEPLVSPPELKKRQTGYLYLTCIIAGRDSVLLEVRIGWDGKPGQ